MKKPKQRCWAISSYHFGQQPTQAGVIASSVGKPYRALTKIARQMNSNGEGQRYQVIETVKKAEF